MDELWRALTTAVPAAVAVVITVRLFLVALRSILTENHEERAASQDRGHEVARELSATNQAALTVITAAHTRATDAICEAQKDQQSAAGELTSEVRELSTQIRLDRERRNIG